MEKSRALLANRDTPVNYDRQRFAAEMAHLLATPGYTTNQSALRQSGLTELKEGAMNPESNPPKTAIPETIAALDELAQKVSKAMKESKETFMLSSPVFLTVKLHNGSYSKKAHVGMEDFKPVRAYIGKRGKMIFTFQPVMVADYAEMEVDETQAFSNLNGFKEYLNQALGASFATLRAEIQTALSNEAEKEKLADRYDTYKDIGFGSW